MFDKQYTIMTVHAHPDDEVVFTGGTLLLYRDRGVNTVLVTATGGEEGEIHDPDLDPDEARPRLGEIRREELRRAVEILRIDHLELLNYRDSGMAGSEAKSRRGRERRGEAPNHTIAMTSPAGTGMVRLKPDPTGLRLEPDPTRRTVVAIDDRPVVEIVSVACAEPAPGATAGGLNVQLAPGGRFEQPSVMLFVNAPPCADTVTWYAADCPAPTVADAGVAATPKFVTVI